MDNILTNLPLLDASKLITTIKVRVGETLDKHNHSLVLFGAGALGLLTLKKLKQIGKPPVAFADNNSKLSGTQIDGVSVFQINEVVERFPSSLIVVSAYTNSTIITQLKSIRISYITFGELAWYYSDLFLPYLDMELPYKLINCSVDLTAAYNLLSDDVSRREFLGQIAWRTTLNPDVLPPHSPAEDTYFPNDLFDIDSDEVIIDCGAFDGDSIRGLLRRRGEAFKKVIAIEPDPISALNFKHWHLTLNESLAEKIDFLPFAVGEHHEVLLFNATGTVSSTVERGSTKIECFPLDKLLFQTKATFIKMDLEGYELSAIKGAKHTIKQHHPILAICLYHKQEHLWEIPLLIRRITSEYDLFIRRYSDECWELICYAVPKLRSKLISQS